MKSKYKLYFNFDVAHKPPLELFEVVGVQGRNFSIYVSINTKRHSRMSLFCMVYQDLTKYRTNIEDTIKEMDVCALQVNQRDDWFVL